MSSSELTALEDKVRQGDTDAAYLVGMHYALSRAYDDARKAFCAFSPEQAPRLACGLARMYQHLGDAENSRNYYEAAMQAGSAEAKYFLGKAVLRNFIRGIQPNRALRLIEEAAREGDVSAQMEAGVVYIDGIPRISVARDLSKAKRFFLSASENEERNVVDTVGAHFFLGRVYSDLRWYYHDFEQAVEYYRLALNIAVPETHDRDNAFYILSKTDIRQLKNMVTLACQNLYDIYRLAQSQDQNLFSNLRVLPFTLEQHWLYHPFYQDWSEGK